MWGLFLLMMVLNWGGYLGTPNGDCVSLGDNSIAISSTDDAKIKEAHEIANGFNVKFDEQNR